MRRSQRLSTHPSNITPQPTYTHYTTLHYTTLHCAHPQTQIIKYDKVVDIPNSMTVLPELLPYSLEMARRKLTGVMNFTNPGAISHNQILELYKQYVDPEFSWSNFTIEEQAKVIVAPRSNNLLDTKRVRAVRCVDRRDSRERPRRLRVLCAFAVCSPVCACAWPPN